MRYKQNLRIDGNRVISYTTHVATIDHMNRTVTAHKWYSVTTSKHINHVCSELGYRKIEGWKQPPVEKYINL